MISLAFCIILVIVIIFLFCILLRDTSKGPVYLSTKEVGQRIFICSKQEDIITVTFAQNDKQKEFLIPENNKDVIQIDKTYAVKQDTQNKIYLSEKI